MLFQQNWGKKNDSLRIPERRAISLLSFSFLLSHLTSEKSPRTANCSCTVDLLAYVRNG